MSKIPKWVFINSDTWEMFCERCLEREKVRLPMSVTAFLKFSKYFGERHKYCQEVKPEC